MVLPTLITGGCGFVGRHLAKRLLEEKRSLWLVDDLSTGRDPRAWLNEDWVQLTGSSGQKIFRRGDQEVVFFHDDVISFFAAQLELGVARKSFDLPKFSDVFHLASVVGGRLTIERDPMAVAIDFAIDAVFYRWVVRNKDSLERVLYASSSAAYPIHLQGKKGAVALQESMLDFNGEMGLPDMTYGWGKLTGEYLSKIAASYYGVKVACVRPFSGYGGDQDQTYPVPAIARRAAQRQDPLVVWGSGEQGRDFVHIDDCIEAMLRAIIKIEDGSAVNIGSGQLTKFKDLARLLAELEGYEPVIRPLVDQPEGVQSRYSDPTEMQTKLGFKPQVSLREGMARVLEAQRQAMKVRAQAV